MISRLMKSFIIASVTMPLSGMLRPMMSSRRFMFSFVVYTVIIGQGVTNATPCVPLHQLDVVINFFDAPSTGCGNLFYEVVLVTCLPCTDVVLGDFNSLILTDVLIVKIKINVVYVEMHQTKPSATASMMSPYSPTTSPKASRMQA